MMAPVAVVMVVVVVSGGEKIGLDVEDAVEIERPALQHVRKRDAAALGPVQFGIGVDAADPRLDAVVTVADAKWLSDRLKDAPEAKNQIAFADVIVLNKTDLVSKPELAEVEARIRGINPYAKLHRTERCRVELSDVLERGAFDLDRILEIEPEFLEAEDHDHDHDHHHDHHHDHDHGHGGLKHYHDEDMQSLSLRTDKPLDADIFMPWLQSFVQTEGAKILRSKGILSFRGDDDRYVFQGVHMMLEGDHQRTWKEGEKRESRLVFIGRELPEQAIRDGFERCIAAS